MLKRGQAMTTGADATSEAALEAQPLEEQLDSTTIEQLRVLGYTE